MKSLKSIYACISAYIVMLFVSLFKSNPLDLIIVDKWPKFRVFNEAINPLDMTDEHIEKLRDELIDIGEQMRNLQAAADAENFRPLTDDEVEQMEGLFASFENIEADIDRRQQILASQKKLEQSAGRQSEPPPVEGEQNFNTPPNSQQAANFNNRQSQSPQTPQQRRRMPAKPQDSNERGKWGFRNFSEFSMAVRVASNKTVKTIDPRLLANAPTTYSQEGVGEDGGFLIPPDFKADIMKKIEGVDSLLAMTDQQTTSRNAMTFPKDENSPWASDGIQVYWDDEADQLTQSKPKLNDEMVRLNRLTCLVPVTEEQLEDGPAIGGYIQNKVPEKFNYKLQNAIVSGSGAGQFTGILTSGALVSVAKDTTTSPIQPADTVRYRNITKMWNAMYAPCRKRAVWLINQDVEEQLDLMEFRPGSNTPVPVYLPPGGVSTDSYARLKGRPVIPVESCPALGNQGDIILADLSKYMTVMKAGGIRQDVSIHLYFDYVMTAFRFVFRIGGKPWWGSAITLPNSSQDRSCFVTLDERA